MRNHDLVFSGRKQMTHSLMVILTNLKKTNTYKEIAKVANVSPSMISAIVNESHIPMLDTLMRVADGLDYRYELIITNRGKVRKAELRSDKAIDFIMSKAYQSVRAQMEVM